MEIWLDTGDVEEIRKYRGFASGVTTNPTILKKAGCKNIRSRIHEILREVPKDWSISVEVTEMTPKLMFRQAMQFAKWDKRIVVKVPLTNVGLDVTHTLSKREVRVNVTACMTAYQVLVAARAGAWCASLFWNRISDAGVDPISVVNEASHLTAYIQSYTKIVVGSIRTLRDVQDILGKTRADVITVPPQFLQTMIDHPKTVETIKQFMEDAKT